MYAVFECGNCGETIENPVSIPGECECGAKDWKLDNEKSTVPEEMKEKMQPQVIEKRIEAQDVINEFKKTDSRGRLTLGSDYADKQVKLAVLEVQQND